MIFLGMGGEVGLSAENGTAKVGADIEPETELGRKDDGEEMFLRQRPEFEK